MIKKYWSDYKIYSFCKENSFCERFNTSNNGKKNTFVKTKFVYRDKENCNYAWDWSQWQFGFDNHIWFRFSSPTEAKNFKRFYEDTYYRKIR
jgi:hypothetical protein